MDDQATSLRKLVQGKTEYQIPVPSGELATTSKQSVLQSTDYGRSYVKQQNLANTPAWSQVASWTGSDSSHAETLQTPPRIFRPVLHTNGNARIIAITSGKGGVGKTNLTVNLAIALAQEGKRVIIIDADFGMANVDVILGTTSKYHMMHLLQEDLSLHDILIHGPYGVNYISGGSAIEHAVDFSAADRRILWDKLAGCDSMADIILVDTGAGIGANVLDFILAADEVLLVTTPEPTSLTDAYAVMKAYSRHAENKQLRLVVNRVYDEMESREVVMKLQRTAEKFLHLPLTQIGAVFEDRNVMNAVKRQVPLLTAYPDTLAARCVQTIAKNLLYGGQHEVSWGWRGFLQRLLKFKA